MATYNKTVLVGRLTRDPEFKEVGETKIVKFGLAVDGRNDDVNFFDCEAFGKSAELINQHLGKGRQILVDGRLKQDRWEDKESGQKRSKVVVVVENFQFLDKPQDTEKQETPTPTQVKDEPKPQTRGKRPF
jgi:single-strand DNA-binding protein